MQSLTSVTTKVAIVVVTGLRNKNILLCGLLWKKQKEPLLRSVISRVKCHIPLETVGSPTVHMIVVSRIRPSIMSLVPGPQWLGRARKGGWL